MKFYFRFDKTWISLALKTRLKEPKKGIVVRGRSNIMLCIVYDQKLQYLRFQFDYFCSALTYDKIFRRFIFKHLFYATA